MSTFITWHMTTDATIKEASSYIKPRQTLGIYATWNTESNLTIEVTNLIVLGNIKCAGNLRIKATRIFSVPGGIEAAGEKSIEGEVTILERDALIKKVKEHQIPVLTRTYT